MAVRILVVEDSALLAYNLADELAANGYVVVGPAQNAEAALALIESEGCDAAVLDVNLGTGKTSEPVALEMRRRRIPFAIVSGFETNRLPPAFREAPALQKPVRIDLLIDRLHAIIAAAGAAPKSAF